METVYKNFYGEPLTLKQAQLLDPKEDYYKEYFENGVLKRVDRFYDHELYSGDYFLSSSESLMELVEQFSTVWDDGVFYYDKEVIGEFTIWLWKNYSGTELYVQGKSVFDNQFRQIAFQQLDLIRQDVIKTTKYFYLSNYESFGNDPYMPRSGKLEFDYPQDGDPVEVRIGLRGFEGDVYPIDGDSNELLHPMITPLFSWEENEYYHHANPLVPISNNNKARRG
jgi:hypothetical protein